MPLANIGISTLSPKLHVGIIGCLGVHLLQSVCCYVVMPYKVLFCMPLLYEMQLQQGVSKMSPDGLRCGYTVSTCMLAKAPCFACLGFACCKA